MTQTDYMTDSMMTNIVGTCATHIDPDMWFPEFTAGPITENRARAMAWQVKDAVDLCNACPIKIQCLSEGMKNENIDHGIWGGLTAGERLLSTGRVRGDYAIQSDKGKAIDFYERIKPWLG